MKTFKQFMSEQGFVKKIGQKVGVMDFSGAHKIIRDSEYANAPDKKTAERNIRLRSRRLDKSNPLDIGMGGGSFSNPKKPDDED